LRAGVHSCQPPRPSHGGGHHPSVEVEMPITEKMYLLLYEDEPPRQAVVDLMTRGLERETD